MTTRKDPHLRGVSPTPSKIPVRSKRCPPLPTVKPSALDQENQDPRVRGAWWVKTVATRRQHTPTMHSNTELFVFPSPQRLEQKFSIRHPLVGSAGPRPKTSHQTEKSERLVGSTQLRNPLGELRPSPRRQNVGPGPPPHTGTCWRPRIQSPWLGGKIGWA